MQPFTVLLAFAAVFFVEANQYYTDEWGRYESEIYRIVGDMSGKESVESNSYSTGINDFGISFEYTPEKKTVHNLRPEDIEIVGALGDSITAGTGENANTIAGIAIQYRGYVWTAGGEESLETSLTIPNILRQFNPSVKGYSMGLGVGFAPREDEDWFNVAIPGARAKDMTSQVNELIRRMKADNKTSFEHDWKLISIFIGGNDLCALDRDPIGASPEVYRDEIEAALDIMHEHLPRALVQIIQIMEIYLLPQVPDGYNASQFCHIFQNLACSHVVESVNDPEALQILKEKNWEYQRLVSELVSSGKYDTKDDFTIVLQPFFEETVLPYTEDGLVDATFFAPDCFHFSSKGHAMGALNLWNNMMEPVGEKTTVWEVTDLKCPSKEQPYIHTRMNHLASSPAPSTTVKTTIAISTCPELTCKSVPDWAIGVICALAVLAALFLVAFIVVGQSEPPNSKINAKCQSYDF
ncbi:phospholipase B1, membrane-associated-like [Clavelina lepadiformis]|uniref:Phospholipase B1, membrane-associated n=1 Tax=Clavelina lepadiformis TaxID=159417 RepID=A0ABP0FM29_CLALP